MQNTFNVKETIIIKLSATNSRTVQQKCGAVFTRQSNKRDRRTTKKKDVEKEIKDDKSDCNRNKRDI